MALMRINKLIFQITRLLDERLEIKGRVRKMYAVNSSSFSKAKCPDGVSLVPRARKVENVESLKERKKETVAACSNAS
jgi:hypothetical protein